MDLGPLVVALVLGALQGVLEWLPVSSEGALSLALTALGSSPAAAVRLSLFLHVGTAVAATGFYRRELVAVARDVPAWRPGTAFESPTADLSFLAVATAVSVAVALAAYTALLDLATALAGGVFVAVIGGLLVLTGVLQRVAEDPGVDARPDPDLADALLVGVGQGLAVLPGVSRSGTTVSLLLLRGHRGEAAFSLSFLLSIPAASGAGVLAVVDAGGLPGIEAIPAAVALLAAAVAGYLTIDALLRLVRRVAFWAVCVGVGGLAVVGGLLVAL